MVGCPSYSQPSIWRENWATCLPHKGGGVPLSALPKDTTSELAGLFSTTSPKCRAPSREAANTIFKSLLAWLDKGNEPQVYWLWSRCSNHYVIASVCFCCWLRFVTLQQTVKLLHIKSSPLHKTPGSNTNCLIISGSNATQAELRNWIGVVLSSILWCIWYIITM